MKLAIAAGQVPGSEIELSSIVFGRELNMPLIHQVVNTLLANLHTGTKKQKNRSDVSGGGIKPWRQKGTGRARAGTIRSPIWRTGGVTFAARPIKRHQKVNKRMLKAAMQSILSELHRQNRLIAVDDFAIAEPKTKLLVAKLKEMQLEKALIVVKEVDRNLYLAARNIPTVKVVESAKVGPVELLKYETVLMTVDAIKQLEESVA